MAATLAKATDCCGAAVPLVPACTESGNAIITRARQVYSGSGAPHGVLIPDDPSISATYYDSDPNSETYLSQFVWLTDSQVWQ